MMKSAFWRRLARRFRSSAMPWLMHAAVRGQGMDAARFLVTPYQGLVRGFDEDDFVGNAFGLEVFQALAHGIETHRPEYRR